VARGREAPPQRAERAEEEVVEVEVEEGEATEAASAVAHSKLSASGSRQPSTGS